MNIITSQHTVASHAKDLDGNFVQWPMEKNDKTD